MPGLDLLLDSTGDYVDDGAGGFEMTPTAISAVRHAVLDALGAWVGDPDAGRELRPLGSNTEAELALEADSVRNALEELEADGLISEIKIETARDSAGGRWYLRVECRDSATGEAIETDTLGEFGG